MAPPRIKTDEAVWIERCLAGEPEAFEPLFRRNAARIRRLVWGILGERREETDDVVQEIFLKAYLALPRFRKDARFSTWLYRIAVNHCRDLVRRNPVLPVELDEASLAEQPAPEAEEANPDEEEQEKRRAKVELQGLLSRLREGHRRILVMRELEGMSYEEMAEILGVPVGTVRSRLNRARAGLMEVAEKMKEEAP